jgi:hypothetical protein
MVVLPTDISGVEETDCPQPNGRDRCELVTVEVTLEDADDTWKTFRTTLDVAIAIGRLQYHLEDINPEASAEILDSTNGPPPVKPPSPAPTIHSIVPTTTRFTTNSPTILPSESPNRPSPAKPPSPAPTIHNIVPTTTRFPTSRPTILPSEFPSSFPTTEVRPTIFSLFDFLVDQSFDGGEALQDPKSPQHHAFMWLSGNEYLDVYSQQEMIQRHVMATFYYSTSGDEWFCNSGWLSDKNECDWFNKAGKHACNAADELTNLELDYNNINGLLPPELGLLSNSLERIVLRGGPTSFTTGNIPTELGYLTRMEVFFLRSNDISGQIPTELGNWQNLQQLDLSRNRLSGRIPSELGNFEELSLFDIGVNDLTGTLPTEIGNLVKTTKLIIEDNILSGPIPSELGLLRRVQDIMGAMNLFTSLPSELGRLTFCDTLSLYGNDIRGEIPSQLGSLRRLSKFFVGNPWLFCLSVAHRSPLPQGCSNLEPML